MRTATRKERTMTVYIELHCNYFDEWSYIVEDVMKDDSFRSFYIGTNLEDSEKIRAAYEKAARHYNALVPEADVIPLF